MKVLLEICIVGINTVFISYKSKLTIKNMDMDNFPKTNPLYLCYKPI